MYRCTEDCETTLEKMKSSLAAESALIVNDSNASDRLIREYEQTMGTVMSNLRNRAVHPPFPYNATPVLLNGADKRTYTGRRIKFSEMELTRTHKSKLLGKEEENSRLELDDGIAFSEVIAKL